jgi:hypothetical protein
MKKSMNIPTVPAVSRRRFIQAVTAGGIVASTASFIKTTWANETGEVPVRSPATLSGTAFELVIDTLPVNITGVSRTAVAINGSLPGPT